MKRNKSTKPNGGKPKSKKRTANSANKSAKPEKEKAKEARRVDSDLDFETLVKEEYKKLQRQYRVMEDTRRKLAGSEGKLGKKVILFKGYRDEKENLMVDLNNAACARHKETDKQTIQTILQIMEMYEFKRLKLNKALIDIAEMEENVDKITKRLVDQKLKVQKVYGLTLPRYKLDHIRGKLEDRLYHITTQFDTKVSQNKELSRDIEAMLQIRGRFFRRVVTIKKISSDVKHKMGGVVFEATQAYEQRDDWVAKTSLLRERNDKDSRQHVLEIKELQRILHHDSKLHDFMGVKNRERLLLESAKERNFRKNKGHLELLNETLHNYAKSFKAILSMGRTKDLETLVTHYLANEQENYARFKYVTDLNHEDNVLREEINTIKSEIEDQYTERDNLTVFQSQELEYLENTLREEKGIYEEALEAWKVSDKEMEEFGTLLDTAFTVAQCQNDAIVAFLGNSAGMRPQNICLCLSVLEHRISQLIFERGRLEVQKIVELEDQPLPKRPQLWVPGMKPKPSGGPFKPKVMVTGRMDAEQDEEEQDDKSLSHKPLYYAHLVASMKLRMKAESVQSGSSRTLQDDYLETHFSVAAFETLDDKDKVKKGVSTATKHGGQ